MRKLALMFVISFLLSGCAIKESDSTSQRVLKHTVNSPMYVVLGTAAFIHEGSRFILAGILVPPYAAYKYLTKDANSTQLPKANLEFDKK